jgi:hypothetical protein
LALLVIKVKARNRKPSKVFDTTGN